MEMCHTLFSFFILLFVFPSEAFNCKVKGTAQTSYDSITVKENTQANFTYLPGERTSQTYNDSRFVIEIKVCKSGKYHSVCKCRWLTTNNTTCKSQRNTSICDHDSFEMRFSMLVIRSYSEVTWELYRHNSTPLVIKRTRLFFTDPAKVTGLQVNGREVNETFVLDQNQKAFFSCSFTNGNPPVMVRLLDNTSSAYSSSSQAEGSLVISRVFRCHDVRPTIRCEAPGSELNRSAAIIVRCNPQKLGIWKTILLIVCGCLICVTIIATAAVNRWICKRYKINHCDDKTNVHLSTNLAAETEQHQMSTLDRRSPNGLVYGQLDFSDKTVSSRIIGSLLKTQYAHISFTALSAKL